MAEASGRLLGKRLRLPCDGSAHLGARQDVHERKPERGAVKEPLGEIERQLALQRVGQGPLEGGAGQDLRDDPLGPLALDAPTDPSASNSALASASITTRSITRCSTRDRAIASGSAPARTPSTTCSASGAASDILGHHLESAARVDAGASAGLGEPLRSTSERCSDRGAPDDPCGREHEPARGDPDPTGPHSQPDDDVASVRHARLPSRFVLAPGRGVVPFGVARRCVVAGATIPLGLGCSGCTGPTGRRGPWLAWRVLRVGFLAGFSSEARRRSSAATRPSSGSIARSLPAKSWRRASTPPRTSVTIRRGVPTSHRSDSSPLSASRAMTSSSWVRFFVAVCVVSSSSSAVFFVADVLFVAAMRRR